MFSSGHDGAPGNLGALQWPSCWESQENTLESENFAWDAISSSAQCLKWAPGLHTNADLQIPLAQPPMVRREKEQRWAPILPRTSVLSRSALLPHRLSAAYRTAPASPHHIKATNGRVFFFQNLQGLGEDFLLAFLHLWQRFSTLPGRERGNTSTLQAFFSCQISHDLESHMCFLLINSLLFATDWAIFLFVEALVLPNRKLIQKSKHDFTHFFFLCFLCDCIGSQLCGCPFPAQCKHKVLAPWIVTKPELWGWAGAPVQMGWGKVMSQPVMAQLLSGMCQLESIWSSIILCTKLNFVIFEYEMSWISCISASIGSSEPRGSHGYFYPLQSQGYRTEVWNDITETVSVK